MCLFLRTPIPFLAQCFQNRSFNTNGSKYQTIQVFLVQDHLGLDFMAKANSLVLFGGENKARTPIDSAIHLYSISSNSWTIIEPRKNEKMPCPRVAHSQVVIGTSLFVFGGRQGITMDEKPLNDLWKFEFDSNQWILLKDGNESNEVPQPRSFHKMVASHNGKEIFMFGGCGAKGRLNDLWKFDVKLGEWSQLPTSGELKGRGGPSLAVCDGNVIITTGFSGQENNDIHLFDSSLNSWSVVSKEAPFRPRSVAAFTQIENLLILFGGEVEASEKGNVLI